MRSIVAACILALAVPASPAVAGPCAKGGIEIAPIQPSTVVSDDGGVVVRAIATPMALDIEQSLVQRGWRFVDATGKHEPTIAILAPGLAVYKPPAGTGPLELVDDAGKTRARIVRAPTKVRELPAPQVTKVVTKASRTGGRRPSYREVTVATLRSKAPPNAVALAIFEVKQTLPAPPNKSVQIDKSLEPLSWGGIAESRSFTLYDSPGSCERGIPGQAAARVGSKVAVAWIDASGRLSPMSRTVTVAGR